MVKFLERLILVAIMVTIGAFVFGKTSANAQDTSVSFKVNDTVLVVQGYTSPFAFVQINQGETTIATATSNQSGFFKSTLTSQSPGIRNITVFATTPAQDNTDPITANIDVANQTTTTLTLFLPPTVAANTFSPQKGEILTIRGSARPNSLISLNIDNGRQILQVVSDPKGAYLFDISTVDFAVGEHTLFLLASSGLGNDSYPTRSRTFTVLASDFAGGPSEEKPGGDKPASSFRIIANFTALLILAGLFITAFGANSAYAYLLTIGSVILIWRDLWIVLLVAIIAAILYWLIFKRRRKK